MYHKKVVHFFIIITSFQVETTIYIYRYKHPNKN